MSDPSDDNYWYFDWWRFEDSQPSQPSRSDCPKCKGSGEMPVTAYEGEQQFDIAARPLRRKPATYCNPPCPEHLCRAFSAQGWCSHSSGGSEHGG
jgi:hypothetical protein